MKQQKRGKVLIIMLFEIKRGQKRELRLLERLLI